jgi:hypothetical protein
VKPIPSEHIGRPTDFTNEIALEICERISAGESVRQICLLEHMPEERTVYRWLIKHDTFCQDYARAKALQATRFDEELLEIADDARNDWQERENARTGATFVALNEEAISRSKLRVETRKWLMSKHRPKKYGDKVEMEVTGSVEHRHVMTEERRHELMAKKRAAAESRLAARN